MSDLYRWVDAEPGGPWVDTADIRQSLIDDGVLVPVEPVYERAAKRASVMFEGVMKEDEEWALFDDEFKADLIHAARQIVHAALLEADDE